MNQQHPTDEPALQSDGTRLRTLLLWAGPLLLVAFGGWYYLSGGRFVSTDNAYIKTNKVAISAQVSGVITAVAVRENQPVAAGDLLFTIDDATFVITRDKARSHMAEVATEIRALQATYRQKLAELQLARSDTEFAQREVDRQSALANRDLLSQGSFDATEHERDRAAKRLASLEEDLARILASLGGAPDDPVEAHPRYRTALAQLKESELDLEHTRVIAPYAGIASKVPQPGQYVVAGTPVISVVDNQQFWIEANFKETQLTELRVGQPVQVSVDSYPQMSWRGQVESIGQASGAEFALLPPQNATGNWVKVVQRIPVRIALQLNTEQPQLRAGMSALVKVDTKAGAAQDDGENLVQKQAGGAPPGQVAGSHH